MYLFIFFNNKMNITGTNTPLWRSDHDIVIKTGSHRVYKVYSMSGTFTTKDNLPTLP